MSDEPGKPIDINDLQAITDEPAPTTESEEEQSQAAADFGRALKGQPTMHVKIHSPFRNYYDGRALSLSAENATGPFDILPRHHNFISLLTPCELVVRTATPGDERKIRISGGMMHVKADQVIVFLDI